MNTRLTPISHLAADWCGRSVIDSLVSKFVIIIEMCCKKLLGHPEIDLQMMTQDSYNS